jgi:hypothetical protein
VDDITDEIKQWYFKQTERVFNIDIINNEKALQNLSSEILEGLLKARNKVFSQKNGNGS